MMMSHTKEGLTKKINRVRMRHAVKGVQGFQTVTEKRQSNVMVRFTEDEMREIDKLFPNVPKGTLIRTAFMEWVRAIDKESF